MWAIRRSFFIICLALGSITFGQSPDSAKATDGRSHSFVKVEVANDLIEDGYSQTSQNMALETHLGYQNDQFLIGLRGHNVYFSGESTHLTLQPFIGIIGNIDQNVRLGVIYQQREYFSEKKRNTGLTRVYLEWQLFTMSYESINNWYGLDVQKDRFSVQYDTVWTNEWKSEWLLAYNSVGESNSPNYLDLKAQLRYFYQPFSFFGELIWRSADNPFIADRNSLQFRLGIQAQF